MKHEVKNKDELTVLIISKTSRKSKPLQEHETLIESLKFTEDDKIMFSFQQ